MQHVADYILRDTLEGLVKLSKHRQESTRTATTATSMAGNVTLGYDMAKYDTVWGPLPTHQICVVKTNTHKRKRPRSGDGASKQLLHALKKQVNDEANVSASASFSLAKENDHHSIEENMILLVKQKLRSNDASLLEEESSNSISSNNSSQHTTVTTEDMKLLTGRASHKSIFSANFIASLFHAET